ncbi:MAG TPA: hypothetical protein VNJ54_05820 [Plantibacter sp.]|uniref:hypothetical protein n=1 Tax=unclassified Plantibacter TaxID=2624265 RepID=UPI002D0D5D55|nr:hypothetical protein [Plantibacter sp.]
MSQQPFITLLGDEIDSLDTLREHPAVMRATDNRSDCRAIVIGMNHDAAHPGLEMLESMCAALSHDFNNLRHLVIVIDERPHTPADTLWRHSDTAAQNIQAYFEQTLGSYLVVTVLLVGTCNRAQLLAQQILNRVRHSQVVNPATVLFWNEIGNHTINAASTDGYI